MTTYGPDQAVVLTESIDHLGGTFRPGLRLTVISAWNFEDRELLNVVAEDGRRVCSLPASSVMPAAAPKPPATTWAKPAPKSPPKAKSKAAAKAVTRKGGTLWD